MRNRSEVFARRRLAVAGLCMVMGVAASGSAFGQGAPAGPPPGGMPPGGPPAGAEDFGPPPGSLGAVLLPKPPSAKAPKANKNPRDFEGIYIGLVSAMPIFAGGPAAYTPRAQEIFNRRAKLARNKISVETPAQNCRPYSNVSNAAQPVFPAMIFQNEKRVLMILEEGRGVWEIYLDRDHPQTVTPTYNGHSVGRWEGDTLVVDIVGFNGKAFLDAMAGPNSKQAHYTVRIKKDLQTGNLDFAYELEDPEVYTAPKKSSYGLMWHPEMKLHEFDCESSRGLGTFPGFVSLSEEEAIAASLPK